MKTLKKYIMCLMPLLICSCSGAMKNNAGMLADANNFYDFQNTEEYTTITENNYFDPNINPTSSFSLDSSSYSYSNIRRLIKNNDTINKDAVNIEQMLNYFNYSYINNTNEALSTTLELASCPWNESHHLAAISVNAKELVVNDSKNNFVFLIDTSGSMYDKLQLFQESFKLMAKSLNENDTISIVTYANGVKVIANGINGSNKDNLVEAVDSLIASGGTNGSGGIQKAYEIASQNFIKDGNNRIILATDGDFNIGISNQHQLEDFISSKRNSGVYLSIMGYGIGNTKHNTMETLAKNGNGNAYYIDSLYEAKKVFVEELGSVMNTVAKDCKIQVEFNPNKINKYRLLGYENKLLSNDEFNDENTDAGEIGEGHSVIALYEVELKESELDEFYFKTTLRYKDVKTNELKENICEINNVKPASNDLIFASYVVEFALILRDSKYKGDSSYTHLINRIDKDILNDEYKEEFLNLVNRANKNYTLNMD